MRIELTDEQRQVLPAVGRLVSCGRESAYNYLLASVMEFPDGEALAEKLRGHGLTDVRWYPLTFGIATLYVGTKRTADAGFTGGSTTG
jgi:demethylmenaquinone methyltransferase/2-methoxy-6-polyprenyl-1,4-benzoquinol methylase